MKVSYKSKIGLLWALTLAVPLTAILWIRVSYVRSYLKTQHDAERLIAQFHERLNAADFDTICRQANECQGSLDLPGSWRSELAEVRNQFGMFQQVQKSRWGVYVELARVTADIDSAFEKGPLNEKFVMARVDGELKVLMYVPNAKMGNTPIQKDAAKE